MDTVQIIGCTILSIVIGTALGKLFYAMDSGTTISFNKRQSSKDSQSVISESIHAIGEIDPSSFYRQHEQKLLTELMQACQNDTNEVRRILNADPYTVVAWAATQGEAYPLIKTISQIQLSEDKQTANWQFCYPGDHCTDPFIALGEKVKQGEITLG